MCFCNGPFDCMGRILRKVLDERVDVALVYPVWPRYWMGLLRQLRSMGVVREDFALPRRPDMFTAGARVPTSRKGAGCKAPHYVVRCAIIMWDRQTPKPLGALGEAN